MHWTFGIAEGFRQPLHKQNNKFYQNKRKFYEELRKFILTNYILVKNFLTLFYFPLC